MKFGEDLERVKGMSDPDWDPYCPNYNVLKQLILGLPHKQLVVSEAATATAKATGAVSDGNGVIVAGESSGKGTATPANNQIENPCSDEASLLKRQRSYVIFFKLLHAELHKANHFFEKTQKEYTLRVTQIEQEMESLQQEPESALLVDLLRKIYQLHQDLLQLEVFAIMTYCGCSKILKKHDKVTGFTTREAFMVKVMDSTSVSHTAQVHAMIDQCQTWLGHPIFDGHWHGDDDDVDDRKENSSSPTTDDQQLFLDMIVKMNKSNTGACKPPTCTPTTCTTLVSILSSVCQSSPSRVQSFFQVPRSRQISDASSTSDIPLEASPVSSSKRTRDGTGQPSSCKKLKQSEQPQ